MKALPTEFTDRMKKLLGIEGYESYLRSFERSPIRAFRVNTAKVPSGELCQTADIKAERISCIDNAYTFECEKIGAHPFHHAGMIYVQEPAAMMPAECLEIEPGWKILDMCAAPGGKSTQLKNKLGDDGLLVSNEIIPSRCKILVGNVERLGLKNTVVTCASPDKIAAAFPETFDMIMVDAPCSGEGMFRKEEIAIDEWSEENVKICAERQSEILECAAKALKKGGYIVYSTCTFSLEENEMTVDNFLASHPQFEILPVNEKLLKYTEDGIAFDGCRCANISYTRRAYPHTGIGEGQFMALLHNTSSAVAEENVEPIKRKSSKNGSDTRKKQDKNAPFQIRTVTDFLDATLISYDKNAVRERNGIPFYMTAEIDTGALAVFSCGINIGEVKKNYIQPHHSFFTSMGELFKRKIDLLPDSDELKKYLRGEEIDVDYPDGWAVITVCGCALGGVKVVSGVAKNHYPKGLRSKG